MQPIVKDPLYIQHVLIQYVYWIVNLKLLDHFLLPEGKQIPIKTRSIPSQCQQILLLRNKKQYALVLGSNPRLVTSTAFAECLPFSRLSESRKSLIDPYPAPKLTKSRNFSHLTMHSSLRSSADALFFASTTCCQCCLEPESTAQSRFRVSHGCPCGHHDRIVCCFSESMLPLLICRAEIFFTRTFKEINNLL